MHNVEQNQVKTVMNRADKAYPSCARDNSLASEAELERLADWVFTVSLHGATITKELRL